MIGVMVLSLVLTMTITTTQAALSHAKCSSMMTGKLCMMYHPTKMDGCKDGVQIEIFNTEVCLKDTKDCVQTIDVCQKVLEPKTVSLTKIEQNLLRLTNLGYPS